MPYFVYRVISDSEVELREQFEDYKQAKALTRELREQHPEAGIDGFRLVFAESANQARLLLTTKRQPSPTEEWEV